MSPGFRLLVDGPAAGAWNMGVDEALFATAQQGGPRAATLRLYRWDGSWLSLGYGQPLSRRRRAACEAAGVGVVQRVTGGLAVLHGADLTYAVAAPADRLPPGLRGSYGLVSDALCLAFARLGVVLERASARGGSAAGSAGRRGFDCFAVPAPDELLASGRKLAGSAQRRAGGAVLQHGSIRLSADLPEAARAAGLDPGKSTSLAELGVAVGLDAVVASVVDGFQAVLGVSLEPGALSSVEIAAARRRGARPARKARRAS